MALSRLALAPMRDTFDGARPILGLDHVVEHGLVRVTATRLGIGRRGCLVFLRGFARGSATAGEQRSTQRAIDRILAIWTLIVSLDGGLHGAAGGF